jgi:N-acetylglucosaminyldiphosphoundecaprenol N-acetyl-beta-D-mannosaminyltransferase
MAFARRRMFGIDIDAIDQATAVTEIVGWCGRRERGIVVTPNLDHVMKFREDAAFRSAYRKAKLVLADGAPIVWLSQLGRPRLTRVTGADLVVPLCEAARQSGRSVFLVGSTFRSLSRAAQRLSVAIPGLEVAGIYAPSFGFFRSTEERAQMVEIINAAEPAILLVAFGAPKQEVWADETQQQLDVSAIVCVGAGLDFVAETTRRAPRFWRRLGMEWMWRVLTEPRRLGGRYLRIILWLPVLILEHAGRSRRALSEP